MAQHPRVPGKGILRRSGAGEAGKPVQAGRDDSWPRIDIPAIVTGSEVYIQNVRVPGMLHGRVVRPRGQAAWGFIAPIVSIDESSIKHIPNVQIVRIGRLPRRRRTEGVRRDPGGGAAKGEVGRSAGGAAWRRQRVHADAGTRRCRQDGYGPQRRQYAAKTCAPNGGDVDAALASAAHVVSGEYGFNTLAHTPIGPMCAVADVTAQGARIFVGTQGPYQTRSVVAAALGLPENRVHVTACTMGGAYGQARSTTIPPSRPR